MAKKYYVVWAGRETGIFTDWDTCKKQIAKFAGAKHKSFKTLKEAQDAFTRGDSVLIKKTGNQAISPITNKSSYPSVKTYTAAEISAMLMDVKIFTDGGCEPNPGEAGSGIAVYRNNQLDGLWTGLYEPDSTNNRAELNALNQALRMAQVEIRKGSCVAVFCDSKYSIQCITQWAVSWEKKGWKKRNGEIKNLELIKTMFRLYQSMKNQIKILHVNGHVGIEGNELADRMSIVAIESKNQNFTRYQAASDVQAILSLRGG